MFFDMMDFWKTATRQGIEDIFLTRYEGGARIQRILYPEKGPFADTVWYDVYGPTIIATNEPINHILATRAIEIVMPQSTRSFDNDILPEQGLPLRTRLLAFRARHMGDSAPQLAKPCQGRLGDILQPIQQCAKIVGIDHNWLDEIIADQQRRRQESNADTVEVRALKAVVNCGRHVGQGGIPTQQILAEYNADRSERYQMTAAGIGKVLSRLGFSSWSNGSQRGWRWDEDLVRRLCDRFGVPFIALTVHETSIHEAFSDFDLMPPDISFDEWDA